MLIGDDRGRSPNGPQKECHHRLDKQEAMVRSEVSTPDGTPCRIFALTLDVERYPLDVRFLPARPRGCFSLLGRVRRKRRSRPGDYSRRMTTLGSMGGRLAYAR